MNRYERKYQKAKMYDRIASFLGVIIGTFMFLMFGLCIFKLVEGGFILICELLN